jgi:hypothetical protein
VADCPEIVVEGFDKDVAFTVETPPGIETNLRGPDIGGSEKIGVLTEKTAAILFQGISLGAGEDEGFSPGESRGEEGAKGAQHGEKEEKRRFFPGNHGNFSLLQKVSEKSSCMVFRRNRVFQKMPDFLRWFISFGKSSAFKDFGIYFCLRLIEKIEIFERFPLLLQ